MADVLEDLDPDIHERRLWEIAAEEWRLPYWDWARRRSYDGQFSLPQVFTKEYVSIRLPKGGISEVKNSLWGFDNPEKDGRGRPLPFGKMPPGKEQWNIKNSDDGTIPVSGNKPKPPTSYDNSTNRRFGSGENAPASGVTACRAGTMERLSLAFRA